ncbi:MAG: 2-dehydro-3-deoxyphosphogluconate aldolase [Ignavibacteria bacterium RBG_13_36_8]|nr:MAG: 2-dehydro-3-deoxyphosphogluconate aldolase [Ignavibacteria bacterium RBG_13_36_8]
MKIMKREEINAEIIKRKAIAVIRIDNLSKLLRIVEAIAKGGVSTIELTMTIPNAIEALKIVGKEFKQDLLLGVGTVLTKEIADKSINAGAKFVVSPILKKEIIKASHDHNVSVISGTFSPTEMQIAYEEGADFVKLFPADNLGMSFISSVKAPLPHLKIIPTGGVTIENAIEWINAGASAVGIGSALVDKNAIEADNYAKLTENAKKLCENLKVY